MKFTVEALRELIDEGDDEITGRSRWANEYSNVFPFEGKHYKCNYRRGTGDEGERPFEYEEATKEIECPEMVQAEKVVKVWVKA